jgi:hypothetical protein
VEHAEVVDPDGQPIDRALLEPPAPATDGADEAEAQGAGDEAGADRAGEHE